jgi:hypothetical protein
MVLVDLQYVQPIGSSTHEPVGMPLSVIFISLFPLDFSSARGPLTSRTNLARSHYIQDSGPFIEPS